MLDYRTGPHFCSASVVHSRTRDLVLTAAHCVSGTGTGLIFVPGYRNGRAPEGAWQVTAAYTDRAWRKHQNPRDDFAILRVDKHSGHGIEHRTGGLLVGSRPHRGVTLHVRGYLAGANDRELHCTAASRRGRSGYPAVNCRGFGDGTSGGAWLHKRHDTRYLVGITGGRHQGGCSPDRSYSPPFGSAVRRLLHRAVRGDDTGDVVPPAPDDGCGA